jgi:peptide/nickel transport system permease protein
VRTLLPQTANEHDLQVIRARYGLDRPIVTQYWIYLRGLLHGQLGTSFQTGGPVKHDLVQRIGPTFELVTCALLLALVVGISLGILSALRSGRVADHAIRFGSLATNAVPEFWLGLILLLVVYYHFNIGPSPIGRYDSTANLRTITHIDAVDALVTGNWSALRSVASHLVLPVVTLAAVTSAPIIRSVRASALHILASDAYRCAEAHGLSRRTRIFKYLVPEALIGVPTLAALIYGNLLGGAVLIESIFSWQGFGQWALQGMQVRDYPIVQTFVLVSAAFYVVVFLFADIVHAALDPRVRL